jgi:hypothetical protein
VSCLNAPRPRVNRRALNLIIEHVVTRDLPDGFADGAVWHVVYRATGHTRWRRIFLTYGEVPLSPHALLHRGKASEATKPNEDHHE